MKYDGSISEPRRTWTSSYRHVLFEVVNWGVSGGTSGGRWNYYLKLPKEQIPSEIMPQIDLPPIPQTWGCGIGYDYMGENSLLASLCWHGGITHYAKEGGLDGLPTTFVAGCDYSHYFDDGMRYEEHVVAFDALHTIDDLWDHIPRLRVRCHWNGKFYSLDEGSIDGDCSFMSNEARRERAMRKERSDK